MHPLLSRGHLEALLLMRVVLQPELADDVDVARLSPAAAALLGFAADRPQAASVSLLLGAGDDYQARLARRAEALTLEELRFFPRAATVVALVNQLPRLGARPRRSKAA